MEKTSQFLESITIPFKQFIRRESSSGILLIACTIIALIWANSPLAPSYFSLWETKVSVAIGEGSFSKPLLLWVNDGLMAIFFFTIGLEIKEEVLDGELSTLRKATLPLFAAVGGMIVPVALFYFLHAGQPGIEAWGVPMATDIAFSLGILALLGKRVPLGMKVFLTAFAIVDDIGAVLVITIFYSHEVHWGALAVSGSFLAFLFFCNHVLSVKRNWVFVVGGLFVWYYMFKAGIHPTIAGVLVAFTVPSSNKINPRRFARRIELFLEEFRVEEAAEGGPFLPAEEMESIGELRRVVRKAQPPLQRLVYQLDNFVAFFVIPLFALANAGVVIRGGTSLLGQPLLLNVAVALVFGKVVGIVLFSWLGVKANLADLPQPARWVHMVGLGLLGGIGFTMALFISNLAIEDGGLLAQAKLGILLGSLIAGLSGYFLLRRTLPEEGLQSEDPVEGKPHEETKKQLL